MSGLSRTLLFTSAAIALLAVAGNTGSFLGACGSVSAAQASSLMSRDPEPLAIVSALRFVLESRPQGMACDFWQDHAAQWLGLSIANRARVQRFGEALHFANDKNAAERQAAVVASIESIRLSNSDLPSGEWALFLELLDRALGSANP